MNRFMIVAVVVISVCGARDGVGQDGKGTTRVGAGDADAVTRKHLRAIMHATHVYAFKHNLMLPPPVVTNDQLKPEDRLSGLVLLLPYLGEKPEGIDEEAWRETRIPPEEAAAAKKLYESIDLTKGWNDPANMAAAKTIVPVFTSPASESLKDPNGYAVSHIAFVRGYGGKEDGAFPLSTEVFIGDPTGKKQYIMDGTIYTLAVGEVHDDLGPWIAAGSATSRHLFHPSEHDKSASFGSQYEGAAYFAKCDGSVEFIDLTRSAPAGLLALTTRAARDEKLIVGNVRSYQSASDWMKVAK